MESKGEHIVNGVLVPPIITQEQLDRLKGFPLRSDDIWVVTYPKAGTTWTQNIIRLARNGGKDDGKKVSTSVPWLEGVDNYPEVDLEHLPTPRAFKSHSPYELMPCGLPHESPGRYIYVARNPKDLAVSYFHQYKSFTWGNPNISWDDYFEDFFAGRTIYGNYFDHVLNWWAHRNDKNVLFMKYEDMKRDLWSAVSKITEFAGFNLDKETISEVVSKSSFESMKDDPLVNYSWSKIYHQDRVPFIRKGEVGDWKNYFSEEQSKRLDDVYLTRCKPVGLELDFILQN